MIAFINDSEFRPLRPVIRRQLVPRVKELPDKDLLKTITPPSMRDFNVLIAKARQQARASGLTRSDVARTIAKVRGRK